MLTASQKTNFKFCICPSLGLLITLFSFWPISAQSQEIAFQDAECRPEINPEEKQYIVGYGSLMQDQSRQLTAPRSGEAYPVMVQGYRRGWFISGPKVGFGTTFLGVVTAPKEQINAVIYQIFQAQEVHATDKREGGYCRQALPLSKIRLMKTDLPQPEGQVWIYTLKNSMDKLSTPTEQFPIVQSYVDIFLSGCLEQSDRYNLPDFPQQCIETTTNWSKHWVNDRIYPRRPFLYQPKAFQIDRLLNRVLPDYFQQIKIE